MFIPVFVAVVVIGVVIVVADVFSVFFIRSRSLNVIKSIFHLGWKRAGVIISNIFLQAG